MRLAGRIWKSGKFWLAEVPMLDAMTQGRSRHEALRMVADLVKTMVNKRGLRVVVVDRTSDAFEVGSGDVAALVATMLRRLRERSGVSLSKIAQRMGATSKTAYARYEQGKAVPTVEKLFALLAAVAPGEDFLIDERRPVSRRPAPIMRRRSRPSNRRASSVIA